MSYYVYVLYAVEKDNFYIGLTRDLKRRISEHKSKHTHSTKRYGKIEMVLSEQFLSEEDARRRERYLKTTKGRKSLKLILRNTLKIISCPVV